MLDIRQLIGNVEVFPILNHWAFFNHAGVSPIPSPAADALRAYAHAATTTVYLGSNWYGDVENCRKLCAKMIGAHRDEIAFVKNTSEGISIVAHGIDWQWGDVIVTTAVEYPANMYPWMEVCRTRGAVLQLVKEETAEDGSRIVPTDKILEAASNPRCKLVALSHVEYASGQRHDMERIGKYCREHGKLFCVDAIQSIGITPVDVRAMNIDYLSADGHKWMLGPEGAGFFYCRKELIERTRPLMLGWMNVINAQDYGNYDFTLKSDAGRFECGTYNIPGILALYVSLQLLDRVGVTMIYDRIQTLCDHLVRGLEKKNYEIITPRQQEMRSGIISFNSRGHVHEWITKKLREHKVEIVRREGRLRASPHFYNTEAQIDKLIDLLPGH